MNNKENTLRKVLALLLLPALTLFLLGCDKQNIKENGMQTKSSESLAQIQPARF